MLLRGDGTAVAVGCNHNGQLNIPVLEQGVFYTHVFAGENSTALIDSKGRPVLCFDWNHSAHLMEPFEEGVTCIQIALGHEHTVLLTSDGRAVAFGRDTEGQCFIPEPGATYTQVSAGGSHTVCFL